jgi:hypothetical protein
MSQVILIKPELELSKIIKLNLMKGYDVEVIEKAHVQDAIDLIEILPNVEMLIIKETNENLSHLQELINFLNSSSLTIYLLIIGKHHSNYKYQFNLDPGTSWKSIVESVGKIMGKDYKEEGPIESGFVPVPVIYFLNITELSLGCDVYIRVRKSDSEFQYIKRLNSTDNFHREDIERYRKQGLEEFYVSREHFPAFVNFVSDKLTLQLSTKNLKSDEKMLLSSDVYELTLEKIQSLGIDERTMELVEENLKAIGESIGNKGALTEYFNLLRKNKLSYGYAHSYLMCLMLNKINKYFNWITPTVREKINYVCYFHDVSLGDDKLSKITTKEEMSKANLSSEQLKSVMYHANKSAEIIEKVNQIPIGVSALIREHHGVKTGVGFSEEISTAISPISMMFIVVEDFVSNFLKISDNPTDAQVLEIMTSLQSKYTKLTYSETVMAIKDIISNKI